MTSLTVIRNASDVPLTKFTVMLQMAGSATVSACGMMMWTYVCTSVRPMESPASRCPEGIARSAERKTSDSSAIVFSVKTTTAYQKGSTASKILIGNPAACTSAFSTLGSKL